MAYSEQGFVKKLYPYSEKGVLDAGTSKTNPFLENEKKILGTAAGISYGVEAVMALGAPDVDYDILNLTADYKDNQASEIELEAEQIANKLREQFSAASGTYQAQAAKRGVKIGEGSAAQNVEKSSIAVGKDNATIKENAGYKAENLRASADSDRTQADYAKEINKWRKYGNFSKAVGSAAGSFGTAFSK